MRRTNLDEIKFPVSVENIFLKNSSKPVENYKAVIGKQNGSDTIFSIVTNNYKLTTNEDAFNIGKNAFKKLLGKDNVELQVFNIIYPKTKSYVHIDVIEKNYKLNVYGQEIYLPFFRITNSYNRTKPLAFDIGFVRELCENGLIFEKDLVHIKVYHSRDQNIEKEFSKTLKEHRFQKYIKSFISYMNDIREYKIEKEYFIAVVAKALGLEFDTDTTNERSRRYNQLRKAKFIDVIIPLAKKYYDEQKGTAFAVFNIITDYASNVDPEGDGIRYNNISTNQTRAGDWLKSFSQQTKKEDFDIEKYLESHKEFLTYSFN